MRSQVGSRAQSLALTIPIVPSLRVVDNCQRICVVGRRKSVRHAISLQLGFLSEEKGESLAFLCKVFESETSVEWVDK